MADKCAQENGYFCALYLGKKGDAFVYDVIREICCVECLGLPSVILIDNNKAYMRNGWEGMEILSETKFRDFKKGRAIYKEFVRKVEQEDFLSRTECQYITEIVSRLQTSYGALFLMDRVYAFLEIADRFGRHLELVVDDCCKDAPDPRYCYYKLVK